MTSLCPDKRLQKNPVFRGSVVDILASLCEVVSVQDESRKPDGERVENVKVKSLEVTLKKVCE